MNGSANLLVEMEFIEKAIRRTPPDLVLTEIAVDLN